VVSVSSKSNSGEGNWSSAFALFAYAAGFSFAYINLTAATGALLLFGAVQTTMISYGIWRGERLTLPGLSAPPLFSSLLMIGAGAAWGIYSLRGKGAGDPTLVTAGNFRRTVPITVVLSLLMFTQISWDSAGIWYAIMSGALTSGIGYAIWYKALPALKATQAATVQLSVPVIAALGGIILLDEPLSLRVILASIAIISGIALVILEKKKSDDAQQVTPGSPPS
jgi:drug/metabolite transporter (DMT)-like permease